MTEEQSAMMLQLQQLGLTMNDLNEYLDVHQDDSFALDRFNTTAEAYHQLLMDYSAKFTPLLAMLNSNDQYWLWAQSDFPWDY